MYSSASHRKWRQTCTRSSLFLCWSLDRTQKRWLISCNTLQSNNIVINILRKVHEYSKLLLGNHVLWLLAGTTTSKKRVTKCVPTATVGVTTMLSIDLKMLVQLLLQHYAPDILTQWHYILFWFSGYYRPNLRHRNPHPAVQSRNEQKCGGKTQTAPLLRKWGRLCVLPAWSLQLRGRSG